MDTNPNQYKCDEDAPTGDVELYEGSPSSNDEEWVEDEDLSMSCTFRCLNGTHYNEKTNTCGNGCPNGMVLEGGKCVSKTVWWQERDAGINQTSCSSDLEVCINITTSSQVVDQNQIPILKLSTLFSGPSKNKEVVFGHDNLMKMNPWISAINTKLKSVILVNGSSLGQIHLSKKDERQWGITVTRIPNHGNGGDIQSIEYNIPLLPNNKVGEVTADITYVKRTGQEALYLIPTNHTRSLSTVFPAGHTRNGMVETLSKGGSQAPQYQEHLGARHICITYPQNPITNSMGFLSIQTNLTSEETCPPRPENIVLKCGTSSEKCLGTNAVQTGDNEILDPRYCAETIFPHRTMQCPIGIFVEI